jgi:hypothetical protein
MPEKSAPRERVSAGRGLSETSTAVRARPMTKLHVTPDSPISVELIKYNHHPGARPTVVITWPSHATECTPAKFAQVVSDACRIWAASTELVRRRIVPEQL